MKELGGQRRYDKYWRKCWKLGWSGIENWEWWWWSCRGKEWEEGRIRCGWITSGTTYRIENSQERKRNTELNKGVSYETSTPHKSGKGYGRSRRVVNLKRLEANTHVNVFMLRELFLMTVNWKYNSEVSEVNIQQQWSENTIASPWDNLGSTTSSTTTIHRMYHPAPGKPYQQAIQPALQT